MTDTIPLIEPVVGEEELANVEEVLESGYMTQGPFSEEFEEAVRDVTGAEHAVVVTSCTTGLELALDALGIGSGDEVLVPDFTHPASANAVTRVGAEPVLVDVDPRTYNMNPEAARAAITDRTAGIMPVSWGGQPLPTETWRDVADDAGVPIAEDAACSIGASHGGDPVGSQFDVSVFSFHPRKIAAVGEAGVVTTDDADLADTMRSIKNFGAEFGSDEVAFVRADATNFRLSDVLAAIGVAQMSKLDDIVSKRRDIAASYDELLGEVDDVTPPAAPEEARHVYQSYCARIDAGDDDLRDDLIEAMAEEDIETQIGTYGLHHTPAFEDVRRAGDLDASSDLATNLLTLPVAHSMTDDDQQRVVDALVRAIEELR